ncbi:MAG: DPP IV N-terminal domain-containing protein [Pseudomonadota bacterium]
MSRPFHLFAATSLFVTAFATPVLAGDLSVSALHQDAGLSGPSVRGARFSPDGSMVTLLKGREDNARLLDLWAYDAASGEPRVLVRSDALTTDTVILSEEEKNRRERQRIYDSGIISYQWDKKGERLLFPLGGDLYTYELSTNTPQRITNTEEFETDPKMSPAGGFVSYVRRDELVVYNIDTKQEKQVTRGASSTVRNAVSEFVAQEELDRDTGYWWSPNDQFIAYTQIDEHPVKIAERLDFSPEGSKTIRQRYPFAGTDNVQIRLGVTTPKGARTKWIDLGDNPDIYIASAHWSVDSKTLYIVRLSRDQKTLDMLAADPRTGKTNTVFTETSDTWINLQSGFRALPDGGFLWASERDGYNHVYRYDAEGNSTQITKGDWRVDQISCVDTESNNLIFAGWQESPTERHLFRTSLKGVYTELLTQTPGWHSGKFAKNCNTYIHGFSSQLQPPQTGVATLESGRQFWLSENALDESHPYSPYLNSHESWTFGTMTAEDGQVMDYSVLKPKGLKAGEKAPAIQLVYGGPHAQQVANRWGRSLYPQLLADKGYVVFQLDNRGAWNRAKSFEDVLYRKMGQPEVVDQAQGTDWLANQSYVDADRIGVQGWSYGGYMTLMMLGQRPDLYKAGISGAPVTDWHTYDTAYTERYMGDPREVPEAYDAASVLTYVGGIKDDALLLIHGMADDNVIFQNAVDVMAALQIQGTRFEVMTYPGEKHGFRAKENKLHRDELGIRFFEDRLKAK